MFRSVVESLGWMRLRFFGKIGTNCLHLPETHQIIKLVRNFLEIVAPEVVILTETNVPHEENISYFGKGDEAHAVYQFSLRLFCFTDCLEEHRSRLQIGRTI